MPALKVCAIPAAKPWFTEKDIMANKSDKLRLIVLNILVNKVRPTILVAIFKSIFRLNRVKLSSMHGTFWVDQLSHFGFFLRKDGILEPETCKILGSTLNKNSIFLDIGANEGYFTVLGGKLVGPNGKVFSIEPQIRLIPVIQENVRINGLNNVKILNIACSNGKSSYTDIFLSPSTVTGSSSMVRKKLYSRTQKIQCKSLDKIFSENQIDHADLVKIDVEGYEPEVLEGATSLLKDKHIKHLLVDYHLPILKNRGINPEKLHKFLNDVGYRTNCKLRPHGYNLYSI